MATALSAAYTVTPLATGVQLVAYATAPLSKGVTRPSRHAYKKIKVSTAAQASPLVFLTEYNAIFGVIPAGRRIFCKFIAISPTGVASSAFETSVDTT